MNSKTTFIDQLIQNRFLSHLLFWCIFLSFTTTAASLSSGSLRVHLINNFALLPAQLLAAYVLVYYQVPRLLLKKKYGIFTLSVLASIYVFSVMARLSVIYIAEPFFRKDFEQESLLEVLLDPFYLLLVYLPAVFMIGFIMLCLKMIKDRFEERHQLEVLQKDKATNELKFLKAQIHPHFLFNTLNNLYALTLTKSDLAPKVVVKLSELLDYILYQCNKPSVPIHKEIKLIQDYIDLETLRHGEQLDLTFEHNIDQKECSIAPLILLPFVENMFKHGASGNPINPVIKIHLNVNKGQLIFKAFNSKSLSSTDQNSNRNGIGTTNTKRQLELNYPNKHQLKIEETDRSYLVNLTINLNKE